MNIEEIKATLNTWKQSIVCIEDKVSSLQRIIDPHPESPFIQALHALEMEYTRSVARLVGDDNKWLEWYWLEIDMGSKEHNTVQLNNENDLRNIKTTGDLAQLIYDLANRQN